MTVDLLTPLNSVNSILDSVGVVSSKTAYLRGAVLGTTQNARRPKEHAAEVFCVANFARFLASKAEDAAKFRVDLLDRARSAALEGNEEGVQQVWFGEAANIASEIDRMNKDKEMMLGFARGVLTREAERIIADVREHGKILEQNAAIIIRSSDFEDIGDLSTTLKSKLGDTSNAYPYVLGALQACTAMAHNNMESMLREKFPAPVLGIEEAEIEISDLREGSIAEKFMQGAFNANRGSNVGGGFGRLIETLSAPANLKEQFLSQNRMDISRSISTFVDSIVRSVQHSRTMSLEYFSGIVLTAIEFEAAKSRFVNESRFFTQKSPRPVLNYGCFCMDHVHDEAERTLRKAKEVRGEIKSFYRELDSQFGFSALQVA